MLVRLIFLLLFFIYSFISNFSFATEINGKGKDITSKSDSSFSKTPSFLFVKFNPNTDQGTSINNKQNDDNTINITSDNPKEIFLKSGSADPLSIIVTPIDASCNGYCDGAIQVDVTGGEPPFYYDCFGQPQYGPTAETTYTFNNLCADTYVVVFVTDSKEPTAESVFEYGVIVGEPDPIVITEVIFDVTCKGGSNGEIDITVTGGTEPWTYNWADNTGTGSIAANPDQFNLTAGTFDLTVTDAHSCTATKTITVNEPALPLSISEVVTDVSCKGGSDGEIDITAGGGTPGPGYAYNWADNTGTGSVAASEDQTALIAGTYDLTVTDANTCTVTKTITVNEPALPLSIAELVTDVSCNSGSDGEIDITVSGGTTAYTYNWADNTGTGSVAAADDQTGLTAGTFDLTVTDANSCTTTKTITVNEPALPLSIAESVTDVSCNGGSNGEIDITASGGTGPYTYNWADNTGTGSVAAADDQTGLSAGTFDLTVTDANSCTESKTITVNEPIALSIAELITDVSCNAGSDGEIDITVSNGIAPYTYNWADNTGTGSVAADDDQTGLTAGTFDLTVTDFNSCTTTKTITVNEPALPLSIAEAVTNVSCNSGSDGEIDITVSGGTTVYTYNWADNTGTGSVAVDDDQTGLTAGTFDLTVTDANSCIVTKTITVTEPALLLSVSELVTDVSCNSGSDGEIDITVSGGTTAYTYNWADNTGTGSVAAADDQTGLTAGTFDLTVTDANSCTTTKTITVNEPALPLSIAESVTDVSCNGGSNGEIDITVSGGTTAYTYNWADNTGTGSVAAADDQTGLSAGTFDLTVTDANSCTETKTITVNGPASVSISEVVTDVSCIGGNNGEIDITASGGTETFTYNWADNTGTGSAAADDDQTGLTAGTFDLTVTDANSCTATKTITVNEPALPLSITEVVTDVSCNGGSTGEIDITAGGGTSPYSYNWADNTGTGSVAADEDQTGLTAGSFDLTVTDANSCTSTKTITVNEPALSLSITEVVTDLLCNGDSVGEIDITVSGGTAPYTYNWADNTGTGSVAADEDQTGLKAGSFDLTVTETNSCTTTKTIIVNEPTPVSISETSTNISCKGAGNGTITITASGGTGALLYSKDGSNYLDNGGFFPDLLEGNYDIAVKDNNTCVFTGSTITIIEPEIIGIGKLESTDISCKDANNGIIKVVASGGTIPYQYSIDTGYNFQPDTIFAGLSPGTFNIIVRDTNGCTINGGSVFMTNPPALDIDSVHYTDATCSGGGAGDGDINIYASGGTGSIKYSVDGGTSYYQNNGIFSGVPPGIYPTVVMDANNCSTPGSIITLSGTTPINISELYTDIKTCYGDTTGAILVVALGGEGDLQYSIDSGATYSDIGAFPNLAADTFQVVVKDTTNCLINGSEIIITQPEPITLSSITDDISNCNGDSLGSITISASGGSGTLTYSIDNGFTYLIDSVFINKSANTYYISVKDTNNCTLADTAIINEYPGLNIAKQTSDVKCNSDSTGVIALVAIDGAGSIDYSIDDGNTWQTDGTFANKSAGQYIIIVKDDSNCVFTDTIIISEPAVLNVTADTTKPTCSRNTNNGIIDLSVTGGTVPYTYLWSNESTTQDLTNIQGGSYMVTVTDSNLCINSDTIILLGTNQVIADAGKDTAICYGDQIILAGSGGTSALWQPSSGLNPPNIFTPIASPSSKTTYSLTVTQGACYDIDTITIDVYQLIGIDAGQDTIIGIGRSYILGPATDLFASYQWQPTTGLDDFIVMNPSATPLETTIYYLTGTSSDGCLETDSVVISVTEKITPASGFTPNNDGTNDFWEIDYADVYPEMTVEIFSRWGKKVFYSKGYNSDTRWDGRFKGKDLPIGTYYFIINLNDGTGKKPITGPVTIIR